MAPVPARAGRHRAGASAVPVAALLALNIADVLTTHRILGLGGHELNPVAGWLLANGWLMAVKLLLVGLIGTLAALAPPRRWVSFALWTMAAFYAAIIAFHGVQLVLG